MKVLPDVLVNISFDAGVVDIEKIQYRGGYGFLPGFAPGAAHWSPCRSGETDIANAVLHFICPCGCDALIGVPVNSIMGEHWKWNGSIDKPTLDPSIKVLSGCNWHGHLEDGVFTSC